MTRDIQQNLYHVSIPRNELLKAKVRESKKTYPFVLAYNPNLLSIDGLIRKHFEFILCSCLRNLRSFFPLKSIISLFYRSKNLKEIFDTF